jgi:putative ABC transport system permease protein
MMLGETVAVALIALRANKLRSALTMLGIVIGVAAVISAAAPSRRSTIGSPPSERRSSR